MFVAGPTYWNRGYGKLSGEVNADKEVLENIKNLGENMVYLKKDK